MKIKKTGDQRPFPLPFLTVVLPKDAGKPSQGGGCAGSADWDLDTAGQFFFYDHVTDSHTDILLTKDEVLALAAAFRELAEKVATFPPCFPSTISVRR
jgi:hypothetical protein